MRALELTRPDSWRDDKLATWESHIRASEEGTLPASDTLAFIGRQGEVHYICEARGRMPSDLAPTPHEDFTDRLADVSRDHMDIDEDPPLPHDLPAEEARANVLKIKSERRNDLNPPPTGTSAPLPSPFIDPFSPIRGIGFPEQPQGPPSAALLVEDRLIRRRIELVQWHGLTPPIPRGPQLRAAVEAILLDELLSFSSVRLWAFSRHIFR